MMKTFLATSLLTLALAFSTGCSSDDSNNSANNCVAGQVLINNNGSNVCVNQLGCPAGQGWNGSQCVAGTIVTAGQTYAGQGLTFSNSLQIISRDTFEKFLEAMGVCYYDAASFGNGFYGPNPEACQNYSSTGYVAIQFYPQASSANENGNVPAFVTVGAGSPTATNPFLGGLHSGHITVPINMSTFVINNNSGFELMAQGMFTAGISAEVRMRTASGNYMTDSNFETVLKFNDVTFAKTFVNKHF